MKSLPAVIFLYLTCTGCTYQYATLSSAIKKENQHEFYIENDTVRISYDFSGKEGPVNVTVYNKLSIPLYVDWTKSALIVGNTRKSYTNENVALQAELNGSETRWLSSTSQTATINGTLTPNKLSGFIPPKSQAQETLLTLKPKLFPLPTAADKKPRKMEEGTIVEFTTYSYEQSPFIFRSYLTLSTNADLSSPVHFDHEFWVSEVFQTYNGPKKFTSKPDRFYLKKTSNAGAVVLGVAALGGVVWALQYQNEKASLD